MYTVQLYTYCRILPIRDSEPTSRLRSTCRAPRESRSIHFMLNSPTDYSYQKFTVGFKNTLTTFERAEHHDATYVDSRRLQAAFFGLRRLDGLPAASAGSIRAASKSRFEGQAAATGTKPWDANSVESDDR